MQNRQNDYFLKHRRRITIKLVGYFFMTLVCVLVISAIIYFFLIEPKLPVLTETTVPNPQRIELFPGQEFKYRRTLIQQRPCAADIINKRVLTCENGYRKHYEATAGGFSRLGVHDPMYTVKLDDDVPIGGCVYQVSGIFRCGLLQQVIDYHPIYLQVLARKENDGESIGTERMR